MTNVRSYSDLILIDTYVSRLEYLMLYDIPTRETFGPSRYINQQFYKSGLWRDVRNQVIIRDQGFDLGIVSNPIHGSIYVHHMNPITPEVLIHSVELAIDLEFLISVSFNTHQIIHYAKDISIPIEIIPRRPGDTKLW